MATVVSLEHHIHSAELLGLAATVTAIAAGPAVVLLARRAGRLSRTLAAFLPAVVLAIVAFHLLPAALAAGGWSVLAATALGFTALLVVDSQLSARAQATVRTGSALALVAVALTPHFLIDGMALLSHAGHDHGGAGETNGVRALAVVLHTLPVSAMLWALGNHFAGRRGAALIAIYAASCTVAGFFVGEALLEGVPGWFIAAFDGFLAGTLVHVTGHGFDARAPGSPFRRAVPEGVGVVAALGFALLVKHDHGQPPDQGVLMQSAASIAFVAVLYLLAARTTHPGVVATAADGRTPVTIR